jgi:hypothetical protein
MIKTFIDVVTLVGCPHTENPFYVVEGPQGRHYVSGLGGRAAKGLPLGTSLKLYKTKHPNITAYSLERE